MTERYVSSEIETCWILTGGVLYLALIVQIVRATRDLGQGTSTDQFVWPYGDFDEKQEADCGVNSQDR